VARDVSTDASGRARRRGVLTRAPRFSRSERLSYAFLAPSLLVFALIMGYPFVQGLAYSFRGGSLLALGGFVGLDNYSQLLQDPEFQNAVVFTAVFTIGTVAGSYLIGLGLALLLNAEIAGRGVLRGALLIPWIIPSIVSTQSFRWLLEPQNGPVDALLQHLGFQPIPFFATPAWATFTVTLVKVWRSYPFMMVSCLAALQTIDPNLGEAAAVDGAGKTAWFKHIAWPHIATLSIVMWIMMAIFSIHDFETIWLLTQGGPGFATENLMVLSYKYTFIVQNVGLGSAAAIVSLVVLMALAVLLLRSRPDQAVVAVGPGAATRPGAL